VRWLAIVSLVLAAIVTFVPVTTTIAVSAITDRVEIISSGSHANRWYLSGADYFIKAGDKAIAFTGSVDVASGVRIVVERIGLGPVSITLRPVQPEQAQLGTMYGPDDSPTGELSPKCVFRIPATPALSASGKNIVLALTGEFKLGQISSRPATSSIPLLRQGTVTVIGNSILSTDLIKLRSEAMDAGDVLSMEGAEGPGFGLAVVDDRPSMTVAFHIVADRAVIARPPSSGYTVSASLFDRLKADGTLQAFWAAFVFLVGLKKLGE